MSLILIALGVEVESFKVTESLPNICFALLDVRKGKENGRIILGFPEVIRSVLLPLGLRNR